MQQQPMWPPQTVTVITPATATVHTDVAAAGIPLHVAANNNNELSFAATEDAAKYASEDGPEDDATWRTTDRWIQQEAGVLKSRASMPRFRLYFKVLTTVPLAQQQQHQPRLGL
eukprot:GEZU01042825.1.p1 GENE.GEZU01042825.1~~GEZU01042825.1.p1  ORF type:complete len:114 (-),score=27.10 GEZU01042825.1:2-343(-)